MRVLGIDPGAEKLGWAVLDDGPVYVASGVLLTPRKEGEAFQVYRLRLTEEVAIFMDNILTCQYSPIDRMAIEIIPPTGFSIQSYLANVAATVVILVTMEVGVPIRQVSARSVQVKIAERKKTKNITKVQVRNGVYQRLPELKGRKMLPDESDALAITLFELDCL